MDDHPEPRIGQERSAGDGCFFVTSINRDNALEIAEGLSLQAIKALSDQIGAPIDWQAYSDAWSRQIAFPL
jgi:hypothetical protein